ncbi:MAG: glycoside hydrolase family 15 protein, partial [Nitrospirales bacterium]
MPYQPIENYGLIGNMQTTALVGMNGSIDWFCFPYFDSPSVFGAILDDAKGGRFKIAPIPDGVKSKQYYWPDTNVLVTRFHTPGGVGRVIDFMPVGFRSADCSLHGLVRRVQAIRGSMTFRVECQPAFNYGRTTHTLTLTKDGAIFHTPTLDLRLGASIPLHQANQSIVTEFSLQEGDEVDFCLEEMAGNGQMHDSSKAPCPETQAEELFKQTVDYWRRWLSQCTYTGRWREMVYRSALALKLLTFEPTGAIVAAPTCSLPEEIGGVRNWDYRYTWIRDAAFTLYGLLRIGFTEEATAFMHWLEARCHELNADGSLQIMYGIDGRHQLTEETLDHLEGYRESRPVRVGNGAYNQLQLDIYGELLDSVYLYNKYGTPISYDLWKHLRRMINWVCDNWHRQDEGVWEVRGGQQHFVFSKLMCWVAVDRGLRLA